MKRVPFSADELKTNGEYANTPGLAVYNTPVSRKDNLRAYLAGEKPLWMPTSLDYTTLVPKMIPDNTARALIRDAQPLLDSDKGGEDMFGINWVYVPVVNGSMVQPGEPLLSDANEWVDKIVWPDIEKWDWEGSGKQNKEYLKGDRGIWVWIMNGLYERLISFMDFEGAVVALIDDEQKEAVHAIFTKLCELYEKIIDKFQLYYNMDTLLFHDDWGSQRAPFFSVDTCREMLVPYVKRLVDYCHSKGMFFELHSCGCNELLVPAMIEAGVDIWSPMTNINDMDMLYEKYGDQIILGMAYPVIPADATDEEIKELAKQYAERFADPSMKKRVMIRGMVPTMSVKFNEYLYQYTREIFNA